MFKPFQIRNLHLYRAEENLYDSSTESVNSSSYVDETRCRPSGLIHLTGPEYDGIIRDHPNARLLYMDDDDGDIITVGSSFELEQRLDEPAEATSTVEPVLPTQTPDTPIHLFDIRRSRSVIELWKDVEQSSARRRYVPDSITQMGLTDINDSMNPSKDEHSPKIRDLATNQSVDLRKQWLDACRPPQLSQKEVPELKPQDPVPCDVNSTPEMAASERSSSSTIMSLSAITPEGRRQAEEAGSRFNVFKTTPSSSKAVPSFILNQQNPWAFPPEAVKETKDTHSASEDPVGLASENSSHSVHNPDSPSRSSQAKRDPEPLLSAFEVEMAKILQEDAGGHTNEPTNPTTPPESGTQPSDSPGQTWPVNLITGILQTVAGGMENLGSELKSKIPEIERHLANAQRTIPDDVGATMHNALSAVESQIQNLARVIQNASNASGEAAERVRQAEFKSTEQVISGLGDMAHEFEQFGKTLFAAFEAEFGQRNNDNETVDPTTVQSRDANPTQPQSTPNEDSASSAPLDQNVEKDTPLNTGESPDESSEQAAVISPIASYQRPPAPHPIHPIPSLPSQTAGKSSNNQPQAAGLNEPARPLFSNWPNRPAFVSSSIPTVIRPSASMNAVNRRQAQPSEPTSTGRRPVSFPEDTNTLHASDSVTSLFMGNVGFQVTGQVIEEVFASKGFSAQVLLPKDSSTGKHAGFGYARFRSPSSAKAALDTLQGIIIDGHALNLEYSDSSPIDGLQTQAPASIFSDASLNRRLHHRHSWQPNTSQVREHSLSMDLGSDNLPNDFSGDAQNNLYRPTNPYSSHSLVEGRTSQNHPEESPEFAARYPSLLPTFRSQERPIAVPERSITLSPNSEIARFPPVSQLDAHLLANQHRSGSLTGLSSSNRAHQPTGVSAERASERSTREPRRTASTINRRSTREFERDRNSAHALRRRATEAISLRHLAHENASRETRPSSLYEGQTRTLPGSFPVDDTPIPATSDDDGCSDPDTRTAIRRSIIDNCVDTLVNFGYGSQVDGGRQRLSIYAEAADGKLSEAIDMIEEERTAYERYRPNV